MDRTLLPPTEIMVHVESTCRLCRRPYQSTRVLADVLIVGAFRFLSTCQHCLPKEPNTDDERFAP